MAWVKNGKLQIPAELLRIIQADYLRATKPITPMRRPYSAPVQQYTQQAATPIANGYGTAIVGGASTVNAQVWGAGGGGSGMLTTDGKGGSGGGGGEYAQETTLAITPGKTYTIVVGAAGTAGAAAGGAGGTGGNSTVTGDSVTVTAHGGTGGTDQGAGGSGGTGSTNTVHNNGGASVPGTALGSSGGGGSGGTASAGNAGAVTAGGAAVAGGGAGGNGVSTVGSGSGSPGGAPGGGGGAAVSNGVTNQAGSAGAAGQVILTWTSAGVTSSQTFSTAGTFSWVAPAVTASVSVGPQGLGTTWYPQVANVGTTTGANDTSTVQLYYGPMAALQLISGTSYAGGGDAIGLPVPPVTPGYFIVAVWSGANSGDVATLNVIGTQTALTRAAS